MSLKLLNRSSALAAGSDLWILPEIGASSWTPRLDWYLNFQILKSTVHESPKTSEDLQEILNLCELEYPQKSSTVNSPLMIHSSNRLPNRWVVVMPTTERPEVWINRSYYLWTQLKRPSLRLFVPDHYPQELLEKNWTQLSTDYVVTLVPAPVSH